MRTPSGAPHAPSRPVGNFVSWQGGCLFISRGGGEVPVHAHYAIQLAFCDAGPIGFRTAEDEPWRDFPAAAIPSRQPHAMRVPAGSASAVLFVEPETREGRAITELYLRDDPAPIVALHDALPGDARASLFAAWRETRTASAIREASWRVVQALTRGLEPRDASDPRILRAIAYVNSHLTAPLTLERVAAEACLSPSRFRHLFVEETGMALRPYILWRRFLLTWDLVGRGESLSAAAHAAGFADAAHLTRTSRRTFGFPPSTMQLVEPLRPG